MQRWKSHISIFLFFAALFGLRGPAVRPLHAHDAPALRVNYELAPPAPLPQSSCAPANPAGTHGITLCWTASVSTTVVGYNLYVGTTAGGPYTKVNATLITGTTSFFPTGSLGGVKEFFVARSFDGTAESVNSGEFSTTGIGNPPPPAALQGVAN